MSNILASALPSVSAQGILKWVFIVILIILAIISILTYLFIHFNNKKYSQFSVVIYEKDNFGNIHETYDKAGIFLNKKTNLRLLFLKKLNKGLDPNQIPYVTAIDKKGKIKKIIYLIKTGVSSYKFLRIAIDEKTLKYSVGEEDVNWAAQDYETITNTFGKVGFLEKYGGYILFALTIIIIMVILVSLFNKFTILRETATSLEGAATAINNAANTLNQTARITSGTPIIVPGVPGGT